MENILFAIIMLGILIYSYSDAMTVMSRWLEQNKKDKNDQYDQLRL